MNERDPSSGGMTGATGDLTPDESVGDFKPGELREVSSPAHHGDVTQAQARHAAEHAEVAGDPDRDARVGGDEQEDHEEHF